jgi:hypothetical protein
LYSAQDYSTVGDKWNVVKYCNEKESLPFIILYTAENNLPIIIKIPTIATKCRKRHKVKGKVVVNLGGGWLM